MREIVANALVIGLSVAFLWHFSLIVIYGAFITREPNALILGLEIAMMIGFIIFAIFNIIKRLTPPGKNPLR